MKYFLIGVLIGIGKIIPGVSGSVIAIRFKVYEKIINSILNYFKDFKKNTKFLFSIFSGVLISIILLSRIILFLYTKYHYLMIIIFALLIISGLKDILKESNNYCLSCISFFLAIILIKIPFKYNINYFVMGTLESISMIIPGISGTAIFVSLGVYEKMLRLFIDFNFIDMVSFFLGFIFMSLILLKIISFYLSKYKKETYSVILGFLFASIVLMFI